MKCLVVIAHPVADSLCHSLAQSAIQALRESGHDVEVEDLCQAGFSPSLSVSGRRSYYLSPFDMSAVQPQAERLLAAEALVLVFPTWWFGFPAVLKGWFDRVWAPGIAYDHASDLGPIKPRLHKLRRGLAITSLGSPWWVDRLLLGHSHHVTVARRAPPTHVPDCMDGGAPLRSGPERARPV